MNCLRGSAFVGPLFLPQNTQICTEGLAVVVNSVYDGAVIN